MVSIRQVLLALVVSTAWATSPSVTPLNETKGEVSFIVCDVCLNNFSGGGYTHAWLGRDDLCDTQEERQENADCNLCSTGMDCEVATPYSGQCEGWPCDLSLQLLEDVVLAHDRRDAPRMAALLADGSHLVSWDPKRRVLKLNATCGVASRQLDVDANLADQINQAVSTLNAERNA
jgi:hypothetical protein